MASTAAEPRRGRGRPPQSDGSATRQVLLDAATEACAEWGFEGTTLARIAAQAAVSPTALYNHFPTKADLLYAAAVQGLERITRLAAELAGQDDVGSALASAYLQPEMRSTRRLLAEIHLASHRDERVAELLAEWHRSWATTIRPRLPGDDADPEATVKMVFLLLLGLCHVDDLPAVSGAAPALADRAERLVAALGMGAPATEA